MKLAGWEVLLMKGSQIRDTDRLDGSGRRLRTAGMIRAPHQSSPLSPFDRGSPVIPPLQVLQYPALVEIEPILLESRVLQHFKEEVQPFVQILGQNVQVGTAGVKSCRRGDGGRQKIGFFVKFFGCPALGSPAPEQGKNRLCQTPLVVGIQVGTGPNDEADVHQREIVILNKEADYTVAQDMSMLAGVRGLVFERGKEKLVRMRSDFTLTCKKRGEKENDNTCEQCGIASH